VQSLLRPRDTDAVRAELRRVAAEAGVPVLFGGEVHEDALLLILSTACGSCQQVATQLSAVPDKRGTDNLAVLVSCANPVSGQAFIDHHGIGWIRHHVDTGGEWVRSEFGIDMSPVGLILSGGRLEAAHVFEDVAAMTAEAAKRSVQRRQEGATT